MNCAADECPTRQYPVPGPWRFEPVSPEFYAEADVAEKIAASQRKEIEAAVKDRLFRALAYGEPV